MNGHNRNVTIVLKGANYRNSSTISTKWRCPIASMKLSWILKGANYLGDFYKSILQYKSDLLTEVQNYRSSIMLNKYK